jgi:hypothetical protein
MVSLRSIWREEDMRWAGDRDGAPISFETEVSQDDANGGFVETKPHLASAKLINPLDCPL